MQLSCQSQLPAKKGVLHKQCRHQAQVTSNDSTESYVGITEGDFKARYRDDATYLNYLSKKNVTELSNYIWSSKENNTHFDIKRSILSKAKAYSNIGNVVNLCISKKFFLIFNEVVYYLNQRCLL